MRIAWYNVSTGVSAKYRKTEKIQNGGEYKDGV
jgi:hypothetical protein